VGTQSDPDLIPECWEGWGDPERKEFAMKRQNRTRGEAILLGFPCFDKISAGATPKPEKP
jgi:hypothetical protein